MKGLRTAALVMHAGTSGEVAEVFSTIVGITSSCNVFLKWEDFPPTRSLAAMAWS